jgi:hypothetical protein
MNKKYAILLSILAVSAFALVIFFTAKPTEVEDDLPGVFEDNESLIQTQTETDLFVHNAQAGTFEQIEGEDGSYILTLTDFDDDVIYFTDRPLRDVGRVELDKFLGGLGFEIGDPPNAAIVVKNEEGEDITVVAELTEPILNQDTDELKFKVHILKDEDTGENAEYGGNLPEVFTSATLLIDGCKKHGYKFCGSTGKCYNPKTQKCGGVDTWKKDKDKKCHGVKLEDAYKYANGDDSECLDYNNATLSQSEYECDDGIKGWKIKLDADFKGEQSDCQAYCIVKSSEVHSEGVARIEYKCHKTSDEKEPKNKYCPRPDLNSGHDDKDAKEHLIKKYHSILDEAKKHNTSYEHHYCVTSGMPYSTKKHWATDCSGLGGFALFEALPYHYKLLDDSRSAWKKADRPLATDFYEFIKNLKDDDKCWKRVKDLKDAKQGDFLVVKYDPRANENSTGHVMWIEKAPEWHDVAKHYEIEVIDSANNRHGDDTRHDDNTYNCDKKHDKKCGIGKGKMTIYAKDGKDGEPVRYKWNTKLSSDQYVPYKKDCPDNEKCRLEGIVIGRVLDCKVKK